MQLEILTIFSLKYVPKCNKFDIQANVSLTKNMFTGTGILQQTIPTVKKKNNI